MERELALAFLAKVAIPPIVFHFLMLTYARAWSVLGREPFTAWRISREEGLYLLVGFFWASVGITSFLFGEKMVGNFEEHVLRDCWRYWAHSPFRDPGTKGAEGVGVFAFILPRYFLDALVVRGWKPDYLTVLVAWLPSAAIYWLVVGASTYYRISYYYSLNC